MVKKLLLMIIAAVFIVGCGGDEIGSENEILVPVSVTDVQKSSIEQYIDATGTVLAAKDASIRTEITGYYELKVNPSTGRKYKLGDRVKTEEEIIHLSDAEYENTIRINLKKLQLDQAKSDYEKQKSLFDKGGVTQTELKTSELNYLNEQYTYESAQIQLGKMSITAPFDGVIVDLPYYTPGVKISQNSLALKVMNYDKLYLEVNLPEKELGVVKTGQQARITNYTIPDDTLSGAVTQISPAIEANTRTFKASLTIDNTGWKLRPGMFVKAELVVASKKDVIVVPKELILSRQRGKTVYVVQRGASQERVIITGLENPDEVEEIKGLAENDRLVTKGYETLRNRQKVKIIK